MLISNVVDEETTVKKAAYDNNQMKQARSDQTRLKSGPSYAKTTITIT